MSHVESFMKNSASLHSPFIALSVTHYPYDVSCMSQSSVPGKRIAPLHGYFEHA